MTHHYNDYQAPPTRKAGAGRGPNNDDFRTLLRRYRDRKRWSQMRCADECAIDHSMISRLENDARSPTREVLAKLCAGLGLVGDEADALWLGAGFIPADLCADELRAALTLVRTATPGEIAAAQRLIAVAKGG